MVVWVRLGTDTGLGENEAPGVYAFAEKMTPPANPF